MQNPVQAIVTWYSREGRSLPWRESKDPYRIWLSEVILQQTRIDQGTAYFHRFVNNFPSVHDLAAADSDVVMKSWEGLGYYSRARNLHATAKHVSKELGGIFPDNHADLQKLKGIGPYTARAVGSIAFGNLVGVVDGNVQRVMSRYLGDPSPIDTVSNKASMQRQLDLWLEEAYSRRPQEGLAADFNQGMMDLGALVCKPLQPRCEICPLKADCVAERDQLQGELPVKQGKLKRKTVYFNFYLVMPSEDEMMIQRRPESGVWGGLWEVPNAELSQSVWEGAGEETGVLLGSFKHVFTHMDMMIKVYRVHDSPVPAMETMRVVHRDNLGEFGFSRAVLKIFERFLP